jgi:hypothetical protein
MTAPERDAADYCEWWLEDIRRPCYAQASFVLARPSGETLRFTCAEHAPAWAGRIHGKYVLLRRDEWEASGRGYRGRMLGGCL